MLLIQTTDYYLYTKKRDIFILEIKNQDTSKWNYSDNLANQQIEQEQRSWFLARNINIAHTVPPSLIAGWNGQLYVDFNGWDDPHVAEYSAEFENEDGTSKFPEKFRMIALSYDEWADNGIEKYEQHLKDLADPDYMV